FFAEAFDNASGPAFGNFGYTVEFEPDARARLTKTAEITICQIPLGAGLHPAHGVDSKSHPCLAAAEGRRPSGRSLPPDREPATSFRCCRTPEPQDETHGRSRRPNRSAPSRHWPVP